MNSYCLFLSFKIFLNYGQGGGFAVAQYGILRLQKYDGGAVMGIDTHVERRATSSRTNPDIDFSKSSKNYDLQSQYQGTFNSRIKNVLKREGIDKTRKNAVLLAELLFTASPTFFDNMSDDEIRQYFTDCYEWACKKYGKENIISATVHLDEKTPHMHLEFVPISKHKLNAFELFNHKLTEMQNQAHTDIFSKYGLDRGETNKELKHLSTLNYKIITLQKEIDTKRQELNQLQNELNNNELYQLRNNIKSLQSKLSKMFEVLESDPQLMQEYKQAILKLKSKEERER